jgi:hypothetical protein
MAILTWTSVQSFVIVAITGFGPSGHNPTTLPNVDLSALDGPTTQNFGGYQRWNYGIPTHEISNADVNLLMDWFTGQYPGARAKQVQAKAYQGAFGGFVLNLTWMIDDLNHGFRRLFNFHIKINEASMDLKTLHQSGAQGAQKQQAWEAMFPALK